MKRLVSEQLEKDLNKNFVFRCYSVKLFTSKSSNIAEKGQKLKAWHFKLICRHFGALLNEALFFRKIENCQTTDITLNDPPFELTHCHFAYRIESSHPKQPIEV